MITGKKSVNSKFGAVSVLDFGAAGDGSQNDSTAIRDALDNCRNVYFPPGNYRMDDQVTVQYARQLISCPLVSYVGQLIECAEFHSI